MDVSIETILKNPRKWARILEHRGETLSPEELLSVMDAAQAVGLGRLSQITDDMVDRVLILHKEATKRG